MGPVCKLCCSTGKYFTTLHFAVSLGLSENIFRVLSLANRDHLRRFQKLLFVHFNSQLPLFESVTRKKAVLPLSRADNGSEQRRFYIS
jgi:hypothetical protein